MIKIIAIFVVLFTGIAHSQDTLQLNTPGGTTAIPYSIHSGASKNTLNRTKDSVVCTTLPAWKALHTSAEGYGECRQDWDQLLTLMQRKDSLSQQAQAELRNQLQLGQQRNENYQIAWQEALESQRQCARSLQDCSTLAQQVLPEKETPSRWWAWLFAGLLLGFGVGIASAQ